MQPFTPQPDDPGIFRFPDVQCPWCAKTLDATADPNDPRGGRAPIDGDAMVCFGCADPSIFIVSPLGVVSLRKMTKLEAAEFAMDSGASLKLTRDWLHTHRPDVNPDADKGGYQ